MKITPKISESGFSNYEQAFDDFFGTLRPSLKLWDYFVNWDKVSKNVKEIEPDLLIWNTILGKDNIEFELLKLLELHPHIVRAIPLLIVRDGSASEVFSVVSDINDLSKNDIDFDFSVPANTVELRKSALLFCKKTGLISLFSKGSVNNLVDYLTGVEAGLDSNARKNRSGTSMEYVVHSYLESFCKTNSLEFIAQATPKAIKDKWNFDVPVDKSSRRYDFGISDQKTLVLMEVNFYGGGGSKLKATAGEYKDLQKLLRVPNTKFVWITDGEGWHTTREPLRSAYENLDYLWNLDWLYRDYLLDLF